MKNDRRFLSGSDEELIQALESLLQQKAPNQDAVHAILDELDRRSNASAFDLERGWADVQARSRASKLEPREASRWKAWLRSAACFLLALLVTFGAVLALSPERPGMGPTKTPATRPIASASLPSLEEASAARWMLRKRILDIGPGIDYTDSGRK